MISQNFQLQQEGGGGGGSYSYEITEEDNQTLEPITDSPGGPAGGEYQGNMANISKPGPEFTEQKEPATGGDTPQQAGYSTPLVLSLFVLIFLLFNFLMKRG